MCNWCWTTDCSTMLTWQKNRTIGHTSIGWWSCAIFTFSSFLFDKRNFSLDWSLYWVRSHQISNFIIGYRWIILFIIFWSADIDESWCHFVLIFSFFFRNYNPEGRKNPVSKEEAMEELIDVVKNLSELKSWIISLDWKFSFPHSI